MDLYQDKPVIQNHEKVALKFANRGPPFVYGHREAGLTSNSNDRLHDVLE